MKPVMQTKFTTEDMTVHGNCHAACIASILELPLEDVPAFEDMGHEWSNALSIFLVERGYCWHGTFWATDDPDWWQHLTERCKGVDGFYMVWAAVHALTSSAGIALSIKAVLWFTTRTRMAQDCAVSRAC